MWQRNMHRLLIVSGISILLHLPAYAEPNNQSIIGQWKNDQTGTTFFITPERNGVFAIIRSRRKNEHVKLRAIAAEWVADMKGSQFRFAKAVGTVAHNQKSIRFPKYTWSKVAEYPASGRQSGFWESNTGSIFLVTKTLDSQFHVLNVSRIGSFISAAEWVKSTNDTQFQYKQGELVVTLSDNGRHATLTNRKSGKTFSWNLLTTWDGESP